jgi:hypothetical protein
VIVRPGGASEVSLSATPRSALPRPGPAGQNMDENYGPVRRDRFGAPLAGSRSEKLRGLLFLLMTLAGNVVVATLAWFLVGLFLK